MALRSSPQATSAATSAQNLSNTTAGDAGSLYGTLAPELESQAAHPAGYDPLTMSEMTTAAEQAGGGTQAAAVGQGALRAARTRNAGGADAAVAESSRRAGEQVSQGVLGTQIANARLKAQQQQEAQGELGNLYSTTLGAGVSSLDQVAGDVNANTNAENASWDWTKGLTALSQAANVRA